VRRHGLLSVPEQSLEKSLTPETERRAILVNQLDDRLTDRQAKRRSHQARQGNPLLLDHVLKPADLIPVFPRSRGETELARASLLDVDRVKQLVELTHQRRSLGVIPFCGNPWRDDG
jgi:hypothetical protein